MDHRGEHLETVRMWDGRKLTVWAMELIGGELDCDMRIPERWSRKYMGWEGACCSRQSSKSRYDSLYQSHWRLWNDNGKAVSFCDLHVRQFQLKKRSVRST